MSEAGYVELPIIQWLSGQGSQTPEDKGLGWTYRDEAAMAAFERPLEDPLVERLLVEAILRINSEVKTEAQARLAVGALRKAMSNPEMKKSSGVVVDYFGVFQDLEQALNFDESIREESLIDWEALKATVPGEVARCMELFKEIPIEDTRACLLAALRRLRDPDAARSFERNFNSLERLWEAVSPDPCLYDHRHTYNWLCGIYVAYRRRQRGSQATYGELSAKTRQLIEENTRFVEIAEALPVYKIDKDYIAKLDELPSPADKAAALEAILTQELAEGDPSFTYRQLGERLQRLKQRKDASDEAAAERLRELQEIADEKVRTKEEPERLGLTSSGEYELFAVLRAHAATEDEKYLADCARRMVGHLRTNQLLTPGWSNSRGGRMRVEQSLLAESWNPAYLALGFDPDAAEPPFLKPAVEELVGTDAIN